MSKTYLTGFLVALVAAVWVVYPLMTYKDGTARNVDVTVLAEPFIGGPKLVYEWSGDVYQACPVDIRRTIIDSADVVTTLTPSVYGSPPNSVLGAVTYEVEVQIPLLIAEGPATYQAVEVPRCSWLQTWFPVEVPYPPVNFTVTR